MNYLSNKLAILLFLAVTSGCESKPGNPAFQVRIEPMIISGLPGVQACVVGQNRGKWLILGGRTDGLHRRQPWATFDAEGQNRQITVVDPNNLQKWTAPLTSLPPSIQEQLGSTNMEFHQEGDYLYVIGGYGYSNIADDHITYPNLTAVNVPAVISAIVNGASFSQFFRQISDDRFAVTGGYLNTINHTYYLTGGQRFDGRYNPRGHPTYTQQYTNSIRKFIILDDGKDINIKYLEEISDTVNLHRRDFNVIPQIFPDGREGLTAFSGVFRADADLPYLNCVNIDSAGYAVNNEFSQYYNQYHCATVPLYSKSSGEMHSLFFGGIAQFTDSAGTMVRNDEVPFVKTIARVTRDRTGKMTEHKLPIEMPAFLGASSEFIRAEDLPEYANEVIKLDDLKTGSTLIGYIFGGIASSEPLIFWSNDGTQSSASNRIYKVYLLKN